MAACLNNLLILAGLMCVSSQVFAFESLPDPTKPAVEIPYASDTGNPVVSNTVQASRKEGLQSVIISPKYRVAVINGETVALGGRIGDATLVEIRADSVVLQGAQGKHVMQLFPGVHLNNAAVEKQDTQKASTKKSKKELIQKVGSVKHSSSGQVNSEPDKIMGESK